MSQQSPLRCQRCNHSLGFWDVPNCPRCDFPEADKRSMVEIAQDEAEEREEAQSRMEDSYYD